MMIETRVRKKRQDLKNNYKTIIGVTLLAFLLWFMVKMNNTYEYDLKVPIRFVNVDEDMIFKYPQSRTAVVEFSGKGKDLLRLSFHHINYQVDLSGVPGKFELDLSQHPEYVNYPTDLDVRVKSINSPRLLTIELDKKIIKKLPVKVNYEIKTPPGYILVDYIAHPDSVQVTGPAEMFKNLDSIETEQRIFTDQSRVILEPFPVKKSANYYARYNPEQVEVTFDIQRLAEKEIPEVPVSVVNVPADVQVVPLPSVATVYVKGGEKILADLQAEDFRIEINFRKEWFPGRKTVKADLITGAKVFYMETRPTEFELIVQKKKADKRTGIQ